MTDTYIELNAQTNIPVNGAIQLHKDKEAARAYHIEYVNKHTRFFHSLREKVDYLLEHDLWSRETVETFPFEDFKKLFQYAYSFKYRFSSFLGAYKFYTSYALKDNDGTTILERFEDRVVMTAVHLSGGDYQQARDLVEIIITGRFQPATPTFLNAGRAKGGEMVSCFLIRMEDNMESIGRTINSALQLSKRGGGVGILLTNLREAGAPIQNVPDTSSGIVPVMKIFEDSFSYANQLGQRQGAGAVYLNAHHPDIMTFFDTKRENADEKIRIKTLSLGVVIPDITFELARDNDDMYLFSPYDVERVEGKPFSECSVTENYRKWVDDERITKTKIKARDFFRTISEVQFESGYPYCLFEDTVNKAHAMKHVGRINMSNLCVTGDTEILTDHGYRKVIDLYHSQEDFKVIVDERARTMNLAAEGTKSVPSTRMFKTAEAADVYRVTTLEGHEIKATEWHKFYVDRDGELVKIPLHELVPGDRLLVQGAESQARGDCHEPDLAYIAGVLAADGTFTNDGAGVRIDLYGDKRQFADGIKSAIHRVLAGRDDLVQRQATLTPEFSERMTMSPKLHLSSAPLAKLLASHGVVRETKVAVPEFVKRGDRETQEAFINGVWQMDGCITGSKKHHVRSMELGSTNLEFLRDMQKILLGFGVYTRIFDSRKIGGLALMPDGKGGEAYYFRNRSWSLRANSKADCMALYDLVDWRAASRAKWQEVMGGTSGRSWTQHKFRATVKEISYAGAEDVFDVTVDDGHSLIFNGIVTGNCSEILQVNTPSVYNADLGYEVTGNDISCNLGSLNIKKMLDLTQEEFVDTVQVAVRALDQVSRMTSIDSVPSVRKGNEDSRAIGLGQMNLHGALAHHGLRYGSPEALRLWDRYMALVTWAAMLASTEIAREHGESALFEGSDYQTGKWFKNVPQAWLDEHEDDLVILGGLSAPDRKAWQHLALRVSQYGMANAYLQTIPPTGSISYINHSTSSIHPIVSKVEIRKEGRVGRVYYPAPHMRTDNLHLYEDAYEIGPEKIIDTYAVATRWLDQGASLTLFFKAEATTRDLDRARIYAWRKGIRTMYYARIRQLAMDGTQVAGTGVDECESCML